MHESVHYQSQCVFLKTVGKTLITIEMISECASTEHCTKVRYTPHLTAKNLCVWLNGRHVILGNKMRSQHYSDNTSISHEAKRLSIITNNQRVGFCSVTRSWTNSHNPSSKTLHSAPDKLNIQKPRVSMNLVSISTPIRSFRVSLQQIEKRLPVGLMPLHASRYV